MPDDGIRFSVTAVGPLLPVLMADYQIPLREAGLFSLFQGGGGIIGLLLGVMFCLLYPSGSYGKGACGHLLCLAACARGLDGLPGNACSFFYN